MSISAICVELSWVYTHGLALRYWFPSFGWRSSEGSWFFHDVLNVKAMSHIYSIQSFSWFFLCVFLSRTDDSKQWFVKQLTQLPQYWHPILVTGMYLFLLVGWTKTFEKFLTSQYLLFISMNALLIFCCTMRCVHFKAYWEHLLHLNYKQSGFFQFFFFFFSISVFVWCLCLWVNVWCMHWCACG